MLKTNEVQMISSQVWRIPRKKSSINTLEESTEEVTEVYAKEDCLIPVEMGKYIPVQTNRQITGEVLIEISDKNLLRFMLPEIVYNITKKLDSMFVENNTSEPIVLKRGQTVGLGTSCVVTQ